MSALSQDEFIARRDPDWKELDRLLGHGESLHRLGGPGLSRAAALYRSLCADLMRSRAAHYTPDLVGYLDGLAGRAHSALYGAQPFRFPSVVALLTRDFPRALRANWRFLALSAALFLIPLIIGLVGALRSESFALQVLPAAQLDAMADAYSKGFDDRGAGTNTGMAGFYVYNNVGIAFRCFATGILGGAGSLFFLLSNGLIIGTTVGYVMAQGHGGNIWTFMCTHAPFELTAIVIAGAAGLQMGYSLVATGGLSRVASLRRAAPDITRQVMGAAIMLLIAAGIEGFWSPSALPAPVKWSASAVCSIAVAVYLVFAGRDRRSRKVSA